MLRAFPMSLTGAANRWLRNESAGSITTWGTLKEIFLSKFCPPARTAKKMEEINSFQQDPDETLYQAWERFKEILLRCSQHYLTDMQEVILFYKGLEVPNRQILDSKVVIPSMKAAEAKKTIQEMADHSQKWHNGTSTRHEENSNLIKEIRASTDAAIRNQGASIKALEIQIGQMSKVLQERGSEGLPSSTETNPRDHVKSISTTVDAYTTPIRRIAENVLVRIDKFVFPVDFIVLDMPEDIKTLLILGRPLLSTAHNKIDVFKRKITLRVGDDKVVFKSDKPTSKIIKRVYTLSLRRMMELDLETRLIGEALILNRSLDPLYGDYIELNNLNEPLELRRNQVDGLEPTIKEGYGFVNANFFPLLSINVISKSFYNSIMKDKVEYKGKNVVGAFMNVPIFVGKFSFVTDFAVVENMDAYRDDGMGDIIVGRPFCRKACVKARRFDGMINIYKWNDSVTYQMARSHPRFKHLINAQCNKMRPLLKVSAQDELKGLNTAYPGFGIRTLLNENDDFGGVFIF
ncbi:hypothetical protein Tco_0396280 [Tanacetum coccineum]